MLLSKQKKERHFSRPSRHHNSEILSGPFAEKSMWYYYFAIGSSRKINLIICNIYTLAHNIILHIRDQKQNIFLFPYNIIIELCSFTVAKNVRVFFNSNCEAKLAHLIYACVYQMVLHFQKGLPCLLQTRFAL